MFVVVMEVGYCVVAWRHYTRARWIVDTLPTGHVADRTFCLLDSWPTIWTFHLQGQI